MFSIKQMHTSQVGAIVLGVGLGLIVLMFLARGKKGGMGKAGTPLSSSSSSPSPRAAMRWDEGESGFMVQLQVAGSPLEFVLDSGSSMVCAKGSDCAWTNCGSGECSTTNCPHVGPHYQTAVGASSSGGTETLNYGTQAVDARPYIENDVGLQVMDGSVLTLGTVVVMQMHAIRGSSTSNILGMCPVQRGHRQGGMDALLRYRPQRVWSILLRGTVGVLALGPMEVQGVRYVPLVLPRGFRRFNTRFYVVRLEAVHVDGRRVHHPRTPKYIIFDTGTQHSYGEVGFGEGLRAAGFEEAQSTLTLTLGGGRGRGSERGVTLTYPPEAHADAHQSGRSVMQVDEGRTLSDFDTTFGGVQVLLLGVEMMKNCYVEHDVGRGRMGFKQLSSA